MREAELTERLDARDELAAARGPGVYAIECVVPETIDAVGESWDNQHDARPPDDAIERLAAAGSVAYVGAAGNVYERLCDHIAGKRRRASFVAAFPPRDVIGIWPSDQPFEAEYNRAVALAEDEWLVWTDGTLL
jgi:hypothetical protein